MTGRLAGLLDRAYRRSGARYLRVAVAAVPQLALINVLVGVVGVALYADMSAGDFVRILLVGVLGMLLYNAVWIRVAQTQLESVWPWLEGARDRGTAVAAWRALACFPREMMRRDWLSPL